MLAASAIGIFFIPAIFCLVEKLAGAKPQVPVQSIAGAAPAQESLT